MWALVGENYRDINTVASARKPSSFGVSPRQRQTLANISERGYNKMADYWSVSCQGLPPLHHANSVASHLSSVSHYSYSQGHLIVMILSYQVLRYSHKKASLLQH